MLDRNIINQVNSGEILTITKKLDSIDEWLRFSRDLFSIKSDINNNYIILKLVDEFQKKFENTEVTLLLLECLSQDSLSVKNSKVVSAYLLSILEENYSKLITADSHETIHLEAISKCINIAGVNHVDLELLSKVDINYLMDICRRLTDYLTNDNLKSVGYLLEQSDIKKNEKLYKTILRQFKEVKFDAVLQSNNINNLQHILLKETYLPSSKEESNKIALEILGLGVQGEANVWPFFNTKVQQYNYLLAYSLLAENEKLKKYAIATLIQLSIANENNRSKVFPGVTLDANCYDYLSEGVTVGLQSLLLKLELADDKKSPCFDWLKIYVELGDFGGAKNYLERLNIDEKDQATRMTKVYHNRASLDPRERDIKKRWFKQAILLGSEEILTLSTLNMAEYGDTCLQIIKEIETNDSLTPESKLNILSAWMPFYRENCLDAIEKILKSIKLSLEAKLLKKILLFQIEYNIFSISPQLTIEALELIKKAKLMDDSLKIYDIHVNAANNRSVLVKQIIEKNNEYLNVKNIYGETPLLDAAAYKCEDTVELLLGYKDIDLEASSKNPYKPVSKHNGKTAIDWAHFKGHDEIVFMLLEKGATPSQLVAPEKIVALKLKNFTSLITHQKNIIQNTNILEKILSLLSGEDGVQKTKVLLEAGVDINPLLLNPFRLLQSDVKLKPEILDTLLLHQLESNHVNVLTAKFKFIKTIYQANWFNNDALLINSISKFIIRSLLIPELSYQASTIAQYFIPYSSDAIKTDYYTALARYFYNRIPASLYTQTQAYDYAKKATNLGDNTCYDIVETLAPLVAPLNEVVGYCDQIDTNVSVEAQLLTYLKSGQIEVAQNSLANNDERSHLSSLLKYINVKNNESNREQTQIYGNEKLNLKIGSFNNSTSYVHLSIFGYEIKFGHSKTEKKEAALAFARNLLGDSEVQSDALAKHVDALSKGELKTHYLACAAKK